MPTVGTTCPKSCPYRSCPCSSCKVHEAMGMEERQEMLKNICVTEPKLLAEQFKAQFCDSTPSYVPKFIKPYDIENNLSDRSVREICIFKSMMGHQDFR